jgi:GTPase SAR1 family protein
MSSTNKQAATVKTNSIIRHEYFDEARSGIMFKLDCSTNVEVVVLVGPSGVGKTTLMNQIAESIVDRERAAMVCDPNFVPVIVTTAAATGHRQFDWRILYRDALRLLFDPFVGERTTTPQARAAQNKLAGETLSASQLRCDLEDELRIRNTKYWFIDEAQHILMGGRSGVPGNQFDVLKSIAQRTGLKLLLSGPYELMEHVSHSAQLARRSEVIYLPRYRWDKKGDLQQFGNALVTILQQFDMSGYPAPSAHLDFFYKGSIGCVGILKDWLTKAFAKAMVCKSTSLEIQHLRDTRLEAKTLRRILADIQAGEQAQSDDDQEVDALFTNLHTVSQPARPRAGNKSPGKRNPTRDSLGVACAGPVSGEQP